MTVATMRTPVANRAQQLARREKTVPIRLRLGSTGAVDLMIRISGGVLILAAPGLWLFPGSNWGAELLLTKAVLSAALVLGGLAILLRSREQADPEVSFDPHLREMRVTQSAASGDPVTVLQRDYERLGAIKFNRNTAEVWDLDGSILLKIPLADAEVRAALKQQLSNHMTISA